MNEEAPLHYERFDHGGVNIIFLNGFRMPYRSWERVSLALSSDYSLLFYNRRGVGRSPKAIVEQDGKAVIDDARKLFSHLNIQPPYLFVAHSLGGLFANLYARLYPTDIAGVVFVDTPYPTEVAEQKAFRPPLIVNAINEGIKSIERVFDKYKYSEDEAIEKTIYHIENAGSFPDVPIAVVSGTKKMPLVPQQAFEIHLRYQLELLELSTKSVHYLCTESGHFPQVTEPDKVVGAIRGLMEVMANKAPVLRLQGGGAHH